MQEKIRSDKPKSKIRTGNDTNELDLQSTMSNAELLSGIDEILAHGADLDADKLEQYLAVLQSRAPVMEDYDPTIEWDKLQSEHPALFDTEEAQEDLGLMASVPRRKWQPRLLLRWTEVAIAVLLCFVFTASALGFNPVKTFLDWAEGIIRVNSNPSGLMELPSNTDSEYRSLNEALEKNSIDSDGVPQWIPSDYTLSNVRVRESDKVLRCSAVYEAARGEISIRVTKYKTDDWSATEEREDGGYVYTAENVDYYIITNIEQCKVGWEQGLCSYVISGQVSEKELKEMINSIT